MFSSVAEYEEVGECRDMLDTKTNTRYINYKDSIEALYCRIYRNNKKIEIRCPSIYSDVDIFASLKYDILNYESC
jgi:hypothetical protein